MASRSIDTLAPMKSLIDLSSHSDGDFGLEDLELTFVLDDIILVEYIDMTADGDGLLRNGIYIPTNTITKAWRKARVILAGPDVKHTKVGDIVLFPSNLGITVANMAIKDHGIVGNGVFLNESRIFGICKAKEINDSTATDA